MKFYNKNTQGFFGLVAFGVLLYLGVSNISYILKAFSYLVSVIFPFIIGGCMAFIINVPMRFFETKLFSKVKKGKRALSLILAMYYWRPGADQFSHSSGACQYALQPGIQHPRICERNQRFLTECFRQSSAH